MLTRSRIAAAGVAAMFALAGCSSSGAPHHAAASPSASAAAFPVTLHTASGDVTLSHKPSAIVSLSPTATEMLFAIGAGSQVKAVDKDSDYPASAPHTDLDSYQVNPEAVAGYRPDLVVASGLTAAQSSRFRALAIPVLDEPAATSVEQTYAELAQLGHATGHVADAAAEVATMKRQIGQIVQATAKTPATYYWELDQTFYSETSATFIGKLLKLLGLTSIADSAKGVAANGGYPQLSAEFIVKANPTYVFLADTKCCGQTPAKVAKRPGWSVLSAVKNERVIPLDDDIASRWGPRIVDLLRTVARALQQHPVSAS